MYLFEHNDFGHSNQGLLGDLLSYVLCTAVGAAYYAFKYVCHSYLAFCRPGAPPSLADRLDPAGPVAEAIQTCVAG
jgi:hypothetical protein